MRSQRCKTKTCRSVGNIAIGVRRIRITRRRERRSAQVGILELLHRSRPAVVCVYVYSTVYDIFACFKVAPRHRVEWSTNLRAPSASLARNWGNNRGAQQWKDGNYCRAGFFVFWVTMHVSRMPRPGGGNAASSATETLWKWPLSAAMMNTTCLWSMKLLFQESSTRQGSASRGVLLSTCVEILCGRRQCPSLDLIYLLIYRNISSITCGSLGNDEFPTQSVVSSSK